MKNVRWLALCLALVFCPALVFGQIATPERPASRILDSSKIFDGSTRELLAETLKTQNARYRVSAYVAAFDRLDKTQEATMPDQLRNAWIKEKIGFIVLYNRNTDKISVSLTTGAYYLALSRGPLENLGKKIDIINEEGPIRGIPKVVDLLMDQIQVNRGTQIIYVQEEKLSPQLILIPFFILLLLLGWGLFWLFRYLATREIFRSRLRLRSGPVTPVLGSVIGGLNTAERKF